MQWSDLIGHHQPRAWFQHAIAKNRIASTFLFVGPDGVGKRTMARLLAKSLMCHGHDSIQFESCNRCESCIQVDANTHPDLIEIAKRENEAVLSIDLFAGEGEHRGREGLIHELGKKSFYGRGRVAIIDDADYFNDASANCMLKTLEEPPPGVRLFLIGTSLQRQMATIRSRSQIVRFQALSTEELRQLASRQGVDPSPASLALAHGSWTQWKLLNDPKLQEFRHELSQRLANRPMDFVTLSKSIVSSLDTVGKEGAERRLRLKTILHFVIEFYRACWMRQASTSVAASSQIDKELANTDPDYLSLLDRARQSWQGDESIPMQAIERSLQAIYECDRNISAAALMEAWGADLAAICHA